jgi:hypothetical protein
MIATIPSLFILPTIFLLCRLNNSAHFLDPTEYCR